MNIKDAIIKYTYPKLRSLNLLQEILKLTSFLNDHYDDISWSQRFWHARNDKYKLQYCICGKNLAKYSKKYGYISCSNKCKIEKSKETNKNLYGVDNYAKTEKSKEYHKLNNPSKKTDFKKKLIKTNEKLYGVDNYAKTEKSKEKSKEKCLKLYGVDNPSKLQHVKQSELKRRITDFKKKLPKNYELIEYGSDIVILKHDLCDTIFSMSNVTYRHRKYIYNVEICTHCNPLYNNNISNHEIQLQEFIQSIYNKEIQTSVHGIIPPYELDIYIPELKLAIEFNGNRWHSEQFKDKNYHKYKSDLCKQQNVQLIHVWGHDWIYKHEIVKSIISGYFKKHERIYARKCEIKKLKAKECREFVDMNHLQSFVGATIYCGLFYDNELVSIMSFQKHKDNWEISRLCTKLGLSVIGGTERLWKYFLKNNEVDKVITYSDRDYFTGAIYKRLGFGLEKITEPSFWYTNSYYNIISRQKCQKHKLIKQGYDPNKTEHEIMLERGYYRCYNSGNYKFLSLIN